MVTTVSSLTRAAASAYTQGNIPVNLEQKCVQLAIQGILANGTTAAQTPYLTSTSGGLTSLPVNLAGTQCVNDESPITQGAVFMAEFVNSNAVANDSVTTTIMDQTDGLGAAIVKTSSVVEDSSAVHDVQIKFSPVDNVVDTPISDTTEGGRTVTILSGSKYLGFRAANSYEARDDGSNPITMTESIYNDDSLIGSVIYTRNSTTQQLIPVTGFAYPSGKHIDYLTNTVSNGDTQSFELTMIEDNPTIDTAYRLKQTRTFSVVSQENSLATNTSNLNLKVAIHDNIGNTTTLQTLPNTMNEAGFFTALGPLGVPTALRDIKDTFKFEIESATVGAGGYVLRGGNDSYISNLDDSGLLDNYDYMQKVIALDVQHQLSFTNGSLTQTSGLNLDSFDIVDGEEYLTPTQWLANPTVTFYQTSMVNTSSTAADSRRADVSTTGTNVSKLGTVNVAYAGDVSLSGTHIGVDVQDADSVVYEITTLLASTNSSVVNTNWNTDSVINGNAVLVKQGADNSAVAITDFTLNASGYTNPSDKITIADLQMGKVWVGESDLYYGTTGSFQTVSNIVSTVEIDNADMAFADQRDLKMYMYAKTINTIKTGLPSGWDIVPSNGTDTYVKTSNVLQGIFGQHLKTFMDSTQDVQITFNISTIATSYSSTTHYDTLSIVSSTGAVSNTTTIENDEFTYVIVNTNTTAYTNVTSLYTNVPVNCEIRERVTTINYYIETPLHFGTVTNMTLKTPIITKTITHRELYNTVESKYKPFSSMIGVLYNGQQMAISQATTSSASSLNATWTIAASAVKLQLRPYWVVFKKGSTVGLSTESGVTDVSGSVATSANSIDPYTFADITIALTGFTPSSPTATISVSGAGSLEQAVYYKDIMMKADLSYYSCNLKEFDLNDSAFQTALFDFRSSEMPVTGTVVTTNISITSTPGVGLGSQSTYTITYTNSKGNFVIECNTNPSQNLRMFIVPDGLYAVTKTIDEVTNTTYVREVGTSPNKYIVIDDGVYVTTQTGASNVQGNSAIYELLTNFVAVNMYNGYNGEYVTPSRIDVNATTTTSTTCRNISFIHKRGYLGTISGTDVNNMTRTKGTVTLTINSVTKNNTLTQVWDMYNTTMSINGLSSSVGSIGVTFDCAVSLLADGDTYQKYIDVTGDELTITVTTPGASNPDLNSTTTKTTLDYIASLVFNPLANGYAYFLPAKVRWDFSFYYSFELLSTPMELFKYQVADIGTIDLTTVASGSWVAIGTIPNAELYEGAMFGPLGATGNEWQITKNYGIASYDVFFCIRSPQIGITYQDSTHIASIPYVAATYAGYKLENYVDVDNTTSSFVQVIPGSGLSFNVPSKTLREYYTNVDTTVYEFAIPANAYTVELFFNDAINDPTLGANFTYATNEYFSNGFTSLDGKISVTRYPLGTDNDTFKVSLDVNPIATAVHPSSAQLDDLSMQIHLGSQFYNTPIILTLTPGDSVKTTVYVVDSITNYTNTNDSVCIKVAKYVSNGLGGIRVSTWNDDQITFWKPDSVQKFITTIPVQNIESLTIGVVFSDILDAVIAGVPATPVFTQVSPWTSRPLQFSFSHFNALGQEKMNVLFNVTDQTPVKVITYDFQDAQRLVDGFDIPKYRVTQSGTVITRTSYADQIQLRPQPSTFGIHDTITAWIAESILNLTGQTNTL